jgi:hypothetical protein
VKTVLGLSNTFVFSSLKIIFQVGRSAGAAAIKKNPGYQELAYEEERLQRGYRSRANLLLL